MDISVESIFSSAWVLAVIGIALLTTGTLPVVIGAVIIGIVLYAVYVVGVRFHRRVSSPNKRIENDG